MDARRESEPTPMNNRTTVERRSERELVVTPNLQWARIVFDMEPSPSCWAVVGAEVDGRVCPAFL